MAASASPQTHSSSLIVDEDMTERKTALLTQLEDLRVTLTTQITHVNDFVNTISAEADDLRRIISSYAHTDNVELQVVRDFTLPSLYKLHGEYKRVHGELSEKLEAVMCLANIVQTQLRPLVSSSLKELVTRLMADANAHDVGVANFLPLAMVLIARATDPQSVKMDAHVRPFLSTGDNELFSHILANGTFNQASVIPVSTMPPPPPRQGKRAAKATSADAVKKPMPKIVQDVTMASTGNLQVRTSTKPAPLKKPAASKVGSLLVCNTLHPHSGIVPMPFVSHHVL